METNIWRSRKLWIMVVDTVVSLVTYFVGKYLNPESAKDILFLIGALQPAVLLVIGSIAAQNIVGQKAEAAAVEAEIYNEGQEARASVIRNEVLGSELVEESEPE